MAYWVYVCGSAFVAAGYADYPLLAYHFTQATTVSLTWIPALYALAMGRCDPRKCPHTPKFMSIKEQK